MPGRQIAVKYLPQLNQDFSMKYWSSLNFLDFIRNRLWPKVKENWFFFKKFGYCNIFWLKMKKNCRLKVTRYLLSNKNYNRRRLRPTKIHTDKVVECQWKKLGLPWLCMCVVWHAQGRQKWPQNTGFSKLNRKFFKVFLWYQLFIATRFLANVSLPLKW